MGRTRIRALPGAPRWVAGIVVASSLLSLVATPAFSGPVASDGVITAALTLGTVGGVTTSIAGLVYALEERAFDSPWIVASMFSSAICGSFAGALIVDQASGGGASLGGVVGVLFFAGITLWPLYWTTRSALSGADPGEELVHRFTPDPSAPDRSNRSPVFAVMMAAPPLRF